MSLLTRSLRSLGTAASVAALTGLAALPQAFASSHSDAPLIKLDPQANLTDVYTFIGLNRQGVKVLNVVVNVHPFCEPGDGVTYDKFSDDALYSIIIADPNTGNTSMRYNFQFSGPSAGLKNPDTILSYGRGADVNGAPVAGGLTSLDSATRNYTQTYSVTRVKGSVSTVLATGVKTAPPNVGARTTPLYNGADGFAISGATTYDGLDPYTKQAIADLGTGETLFAGPREDSFFADTPGIFDLLDPRILGSSLGQAGGGVDGFKGFNVLTFAIQIPVSQLTPAAYTAVLGPATHGVGVYASVSRPRITLRSATSAPTGSGPWVQVNRLGNPLFNEVLVALRDKDNYNRDEPNKDAAKYAKYAMNPEVAALINIVFGTNFVTSGRADLVAVYIPDVVRVSTDTGPVKQPGQPGFNRLSFIGGDTTDGLSGGWPNGRRFGDDVVDIALTAVASGPTFSTITVVGDNVLSNDQTYNQVFPYAATPHSGAKNRKDSL